VKGEGGNFSFWEWFFPKRELYPFKGKFFGLKFPLKRGVFKILGCGRGIKNPFIKNREKRNIAFFQKTLFWGREIITRGIKRENSRINLGLEKIWGLLN